MKAKIIGITTPAVDEIIDSEGLISYSARVSNPSNQTNFDTANKLLAYCKKPVSYTHLTLPTNREV